MAISSLFDLPCPNLQLNRLPSSQLKVATSKCLSFSTNLSCSFFTKGCLSMSTFQRSNHYDVVCKARKFAPRRYTHNSSRMKKSSRKKSGDPTKKIKRRRGGRNGMKKKEFKIVRLVSTAGTGVLYAKKKSMQIKEKLEFRKYDPQLHRHTLFEEVE